MVSKLSNKVLIVMVGCNSYR